MTEAISARLDGEILKELGQAVHLIIVVRRPWFIQDTWSSSQNTGIQKFRIKSNIQEFVVDVAHIPHYSSSKPGCHPNI